MNPNGTYTYTPNSAFFGNDTLIYVVCDNGIPSLCDTAIVVIGVNVQNVSPLAADDNFSTNEDTPLSADVSLNDSDPNGGPVSFSLANPPLHAVSLLLNPDGTFTYVPNPNYNGPDSFTYVVCDNGSPVLCDSGTVFINVIPVNDAPVAVDDVNGTIISFPVSGDVSTNDFDVDGDTHIFCINKSNTWKYCFKYERNLYLHANRNSWNRLDNLCGLR